GPRKSGPFVGGLDIWGGLAYLRSFSCSNRFPPLLILQERALVFEMGIQTRKQHFGPLANITIGGVLQLCGDRASRWSLVVERHHLREGKAKLLPAGRE